MNDQINVAIIDDGVNEKLYNTGVLKYNIEITPNLMIRERKKYDKYKSSHGTTCAAIIKKYLPYSVLSSIKILNDKCEGSVEQLSLALKLCADKEINLINLSLGSTYFDDFKILKESLEYCYKKGVIIVAAISNENTYTYPASLTNIIGVKCDKKGRIKEGKYIYIENSLDGVNIISTGSHNIKNFKGINGITNNCNSFVVPFIISEVYNMMKENLHYDLNSVKKYLKQKSSNNLLEEIDIVFKENYVSSDFEKYLRLKNNLDIPIILVNNFENSSKYNFLYELVKCFRNDKYNCVGININSNRQINIFQNNVINNYNGNIDKNLFNTIYYIYDPDIFIININNDTRYMHKIRKILEVDINILINTNVNNYSSNIVFQREKYENIINIREKRNHKIYENANVFVNENKYIFGLYDYLKEVLH
ncbi:peptidase [Clostridium botulinum]|uniref:S8 family peptidase n=1 Tax=Clostridium botulinum TaxID=1491 RepID=UPI000A175B8C|nr:S8 family serine peptidase [Clostridium botulinum]AUM88833.1 peptidase [Clostridium botulinum]AUN11853.1 peptidase [Clostridium botulinum]AUN22796.1 peptidase [Clostridium botulinum]AUN26506.1 peptidase [Clostridium botulinum]NFO69316.1 peptidase [Clostridium botulinum]